MISPNENAAPEAPVAFKKTQVRTLLLCIVSSALAFFSTDIYLPFMTRLSVVLNTHVSTMQGTVTVFMMALALSNFVMTPLADHFGRRTMLLCGLVCATCGSLVLLYPSLPTFIVGRFMQGMGAATGLGLSRVIIRDIAADRTQLTKMYALYSTLLCIAPAMSPLLGASIQQHFRWQTVFIVLGLLYGMHTLLVVRFFKETCAHHGGVPRGVRHLMQSYRHALRSPYFMISCMMSAVTFGLSVAYITALPFILQLQLGQSVMTTGWAMASLVIGGLGSRIVNMLLLNVCSEQTRFLCALAIQVLAVMLYVGTQLFYQANVYTVIVPGILYVFSTGFLFTYYATSAMAQFSSGIGTASAVYSGLQVVGGVFLSALVAVNQHNDMQLMRWLLGLGITVIVLLKFLRDRYEAPSALGTPKQ